MWGAMNGHAQPFKTWIIQDGMALMWQGRGIVAISVLLTVLISGLGSVVPGPSLLDTEGTPSLIGAIGQVIWFAIYAIPLIPVAYISHIAVLRGEVGFAAMLSNGLAGVLYFARGMMAAVVVAAVLGALYQLVFVSDLLLMSAGRVDASAALRLGVGAMVALLAFALFVLLGAWGATLGGGSVPAHSLSLGVASHGAGGGDTGCRWHPRRSGIYDRQCGIFCINRLFRGCAGFCDLLSGLAVGKVEGTAQNRMGL